MEDCDDAMGGNAFDAGHTVVPSPHVGAMAAPGTPAVFAAEMPGSRRGSLVQLTAPAVPPTPAESAAYAAHPMTTRRASYVAPAAASASRRASLAAPPTPHFGAAAVPLEPAADFKSLYMGAASQLSGMWDELGVAPAERAAELQALTEAVAAVFSARVAREDARRTQTVRDIEETIAGCMNLQRSMELQEGVPPKPDAMPLLAYLANLAEARRQLQAAWDANAMELQSLEATLRGLHADVSEPLDPSFAAIGDRVCARRIAAYKAEVEKVAAVKADRTAAITSLCEEILVMWNEMAQGPAPGDAFEACIPALGAGLGWAKGVIAQLQAKSYALQTERHARETRIQTLGAEITTLWKRLATPEAEQTAFLEAHAGLGDDVMQAIESYLAAKRHEFSVRLVDLIGAARATIAGMWTEMRAGPATRASMFPLYAVTEGFTDELYLAHEAFITELSAKLETLRPMLRAIEKRDELLRDKAEYEVIIQDATRLTKGSSSARLREEKLERRVKKELPAVTKKLRTQVQEWEAANGGVQLLVDDVVFLSQLDAEEAADDKKREETRAAIRGTAGGAAGAMAPTAASAAAAPAAAAAAAPAGGAGGVVPRRTGTLLGAALSARDVNATAGVAPAAATKFGGMKPVGAAAHKPGDAGAAVAAPAAPAVVVGALQVSEASKAAAARMMQQLS